MQVFQCRNLDKNQSRGTATLTGANQVPAVISASNSPRWWQPRSRWTPAAGRRASGRKTSWWRPESVLRRPLGYGVMMSRPWRQSPDLAACGSRVADAAEERRGNTGGVEGLGHLYKAIPAVYRQKKRKKEKKKLIVTHSQHRHLINTSRWG